MPTKRNRVSSTSVDNGYAHIKSYSDPALGEQRVVNRRTYDMRNLNADTLLNLAPYAFLAIAGTRYQRVSGHPDVAKITQELYEEMVAGNWQPHKRDISSSGEPTDLMKAVAEATNTPVHVVQHEFYTRMVLLNDGTLYKDKAGKTRRFFSTAVQKQLAADPAIAPIVARLEQERAKATLVALKGTKQPSKLAALFTLPPADITQNEPAETAEAAQ